MLFEVRKIIGPVLFILFVHSFSLSGQSIVYNSTVNLIGFSKAKADGSVDTITGTSFVFGFFPKEEEEGVRFAKKNIYLVTNTHVINGMDQCIMNFTKAKYQESIPLPDYGNNWQIKVTDFGRSWIPHPDTSIDLAIFPLYPILLKAEQENVSLFLQPLSEKLFPSEEEWVSYSSIESVIMSGYPKGLMDPINNVPIVRMGSLATPLNLDYFGNREILIDIPIFPGSSGSPIFLKDPVFGIDGKYITSGYKYKFIGVACKSFTYKSKGSIKVVNIPTDPTIDFRYDLPLSIAICIKSTELIGFYNIVKSR